MILLLNGNRACCPVLESFLHFSGSSLLQQWGLKVKEYDGCVAVQ